MAQPRPERGPGTIGDLGQLADELDELAWQLETPRAPGGYAGELVGLARIMRSLDSADAEPWTHVDLLALFGNAGPVAAALRGRRLSGRVLSAASRVLVVFLVLCVPLEITFASRAYGRMIRDPSQQAAAIGDGFPRLWENGFGGQLPKLLDLTHVAGYSLAAGLALIVLTLVRAWQAQAYEHTELEFTARLISALTRAQLALSQRRLDAPGRLTGELSAAARRLGKMIASASRAAEETGAMVSGAESLIRSSSKVTMQLQTSATELGTSAQRLQAAGGKIEESVFVLGGAVDRLGGEITSRIAVATDGLAAAGGDFATRIGASGHQAARDIGAVYQEAVAAAAADLEEKMTLVGEQLAIAVEDVRTAAQSLGSSAGHMTEAVSELSRAIVGSAVLSPAPSSDDGSENALLKGA